MKKGGYRPFSGSCRDRDFWSHVATLGVVLRQELALGSEVLL